MAIMPLNKEQHKARHKMLHKYLDELIADFVDVDERALTKTTLLEFMAWSHEQTIEPTEGK